jgi:catechol 2,3-dioxygenase-like lactoylglutathione lyase family enzyme
MRQLRLIAVLGIVVALAFLGGERSVRADPQQPPDLDGRPGMDLGAFSVSLAVKNLAASRAFYEKLGFEVIMGEAAQNWLILQDGASTIGLFQGMFEKNTLTFNPGWANRGEHPEQFTDVREIQRRLKARGLELTTEADETTSGPAFLMLLDPDGNPILMDQHVG